ncbi:probable salivary secreted peptide [Epargyreus clarus]|uniref:probable salivary secreted peptide n=1 Tax=Epargyreus clarus TaxID=520877 RepID=UPI003C2E05B5
MKSILALSVVLALAVVTNTAVVKGPANVNLGFTSSSDKLLFRQYVYQPAIPNSVQYQDVVFRGNRSTRITAIYASEVGYTQYASVRVLYGGVGYQNVTLRVQSAKGYGYYYLIDIWGR